MATKKKGAGTPATTALDRAGVPYTLYAYHHDAAATNFGEEAAAKLEVDPRSLFKTLVVVHSGSALAVAVVPVSSHLNLKAMAAALGAKRVAMARPEAAARSSGYVIGGISPIGQRTALPTVVDSSAQDQRTILVSAGRRGLQVQLAPGDLVTVTGGRFAPLILPA